MAGLVRGLIQVLVIGSLVSGTGCAGFKLFSSTHTHYHETENTKERIDALEQRLEALERTRPRTGIEEEGAGKERASQVTPFMRL